jgi:uncharacterized protein YjbJ (UPF0337 family)
MCTLSRVVLVSGAKSALLWFVVSVVCGGEKGQKEARLTMEGTKDILQGKWHELKGQVRAKWGEITDDDLTRLSGKTEELAGLLQQRYGYARSKADAEIDDWLRKH